MELSISVRTCFSHDGFDLSYVGLPSSSHNSCKRSVTGFALVRRKTRPKNWRRLRCTVCHLSPLTLNNMRTSELETFPRAQSTNHARREIRDSCLFSTRLCSTQCFESAVVCAPLFTLPITLARLYIEPSCTPCVSECLDDRGGPSLSRFLHTRFQVSSPRRRVSRLSDGLFPHALSGMLEFDRLPPHGSSRYAQVACHSARVHSA